MPSTHHGILVHVIFSTKQRLKLLLKIHPSFAIADTIKLIKGNASRWINQEKKIPARFEWQRGYGAFSVSESMSEIVKRYIENQRIHHQRQSFEDEYFEILRKHRIQFDERFVFDDEIVA